LGEGGRCGISYTGIIPPSRGAEGVGGISNSFDFILSRRRRWGLFSRAASKRAAFQQRCFSYKKIKKISLYKRKFEKTGCKSYMRKAFFLYEEICKMLVI
jgi:hypothetical protein